MNRKIVSILVMTLLIASCMTVASMALEKLNPITIDNSRQSDGHTLITEFSNLPFSVGRVIEVNSSGSIVWEKIGLLSPMDVERLDNGNTLITELWGEVFEVDSGGNTVWYKIGLFSTYDAERLDNGNTLITEYGMDRVIEVNSSGSIVWEKAGLLRPVDAERLDNGNTLITEHGMDRVIEVDSGGNIVWEKAGLRYVLDAERLDNGNTLITEYLLGRVIEVDSGGNIVWEKINLLCPVDAERLDNGNTLITLVWGRVIEVDSGSNIVWEKNGLLNETWDAERLMPSNAPYAPAITGETIGKSGTEYEYIFNAVDPNGDNVKYHIDWGDGNSETTGFSPSGTDVKVKHTWNEVGVYIIRASAEDTEGLVGLKGLLSVSMPKSKLYINTPFLRFLENHPLIYQLLQRLLKL